MNTKSWGTF